MIGSSWTRPVTCAVCAVIAYVFMPSPSNSQGPGPSAAQTTINTSGQVSSEQPAQPAHPVLKRLVSIPKNAALGVLEVVWVVKLAVTGEDMWSEGYHHQKRKEEMARSLPGSLDH
jgi:hypothetical protein